MIREPLRAPQPLLFADLPDEDQRPLRLDGAFRERLGDFEDGDRARAVVVGAIADRVGPRRIDFAQRIFDRVDADPLLGGGRRGAA